MDQLVSHLAPSVRRPYLLWGAVLLITAACGWSLFQAYVQHLEAARSSQAYEQLRAVRNTRPVVKVNRAEADERKRWDALAAERDFKWSPIFLAVERTANANIELLEFQPEKASRHVLLRGEARDQAALTAFLDALAGQKALKSVHLVHQKNKLNGRLSTVEFEIQASIEN
ncbi:MAG: PilN domain-containing protein [Pseudomonadota bacterium]